MKVLPKASKKPLRNKPLNSEFHTKSTYLQTELDQDIVKVTVKKTSLNAEKYSSSRRFATLLITAIALVAITISIVGIVLISIRNEETTFLKNVKMITVTSSPDKANVYIDNLYLGITPLSLANVNLNSSRDLTVAKEGFEMQTRRISSIDQTNTYDFALSPTYTPIILDQNPVSLSEYGLNLNLPVGYSMKKVLMTTPCVDVKATLKDQKKCSGANLQTISYVFTFSNKGEKSQLTLKPMLKDEFCILDAGQCNPFTFTKDISVMNQKIELEGRLVMNGQSTSSVQVNGTEYVALFVSFDKISLDQAEQILNTVSKV